MYSDTAHSSPSSQKFAIAYSKEWVINAYSDLTAENRAKVPAEIEINIDTFNDKTEDGADEERLIAALNELITSEKNTELEKAKLSSFEEYCKWGGIGCLGIGALALLFSVLGGGLAAFFIGLLSVVGGIGLLTKHYSKLKFVVAQKEQIEKQFEEKREKALMALKATIAEIVDYRKEFAQKEEESEKVIDYLDQISPDQYVKRVSGSPRRIGIEG